MRTFGSCADNKPRPLRYARASHGLLAALVDITTYTARNQTSVIQTTFRHFMCWVITVDWLLFSDAVSTVEVTGLERLFEASWSSENSVNVRSAWCLSPRFWYHIKQQADSTDHHHLHIIISSGSTRKSVYWCYHLNWGFHLQSNQASRDRCKHTSCTAMTKSENITTNNDYTRRRSRSIRRCFSIQTNCKD